MDTRQALWSYINSSIPELSRDTIPVPAEKKRWHKDLPAAMSQPRSREIAWNDRFSGKRFSKKHSENILALCIYLTGKEADQPCGRCQKGLGPFSGCILPHDSTWISSSQKACANCIYNWQKLKCSHHWEDVHDAGQEGEQEGEVNAEAPVDGEEEDGADAPVDSEEWVDIDDAVDGEEEDGAEATVYDPLVTGTQEPLEQEPLDHDWVLNPEHINAHMNAAYSPRHLASRVRQIGTINDTHMGVMQFIIGPYQRKMLPASHCCRRLGTVLQGPVKVQLEHGDPLKLENKYVFCIQPGRVCYILNEEEIAVSIQIVAIGEELPDPETS